MNFATLVSRLFATAKPIDAETATADAVRIADVRMFEFLTHGASRPALVVAAEMGLTRDRIAAALAVLRAAERRAYA